uniref:Uncharacterized protein n=1 Tax=Percolomonas cosmopolitus TaxID=63605 RepID=A0A7S1KM31_9EUKA
MNPDQLLLKRLESNAHEIATKYALYASGGAGNAAPSGDSPAQSNPAKQQRNLNSSTPVRNIMRDSDFMEPEDEGADGTARQLNESGQSTSAHERQQRQRHNVSHSDSQDGTLNDSSMLMTSTISFIKDNIEQQKDPSSEQILDYINRLIKSKVGTSMVEDDDDEEEEEQSGRPSDDVRRDSAGDSSSAQQHQAQVEQPFVSYSQKQKILLREDRYGMDDNAEGTNDYLQDEMPVYDQEQDEDDEQQQEHSEEEETSVEDEEYDDDDQDYNDSQVRHPQQSRRVPPQLEQEEIILAPPPKLNQSASPQNFVSGSGDHHSKVKRFVAQSKSPLRAQTSIEHLAKASSQTPPVSQKRSSDGDNYPSPSPSPHHQNYNKLTASFHSPTGSGTIKSSTSILRSVLNSSQSQLSHLDHPPFLHQQGKDRNDKRGTSTRIGGAHNDASSMPEGFHSYPSSTTAEDIPSEIQIPKPQTERAEEKIIYYLKYLTNKSQIVRFDAVKSLNEIYNRILNGAPSLDHVHTDNYSRQYAPQSDDLNVLKLYTSTIVDELILCLEAYQHQEEAFNMIVVQTLALMGERAQAAVSVLIKMLKDVTLYALYESILKTLFNIGSVGLEALLEAASNAASEWDSFILTHIANHPAVQEHVVVPALIRESQVGDMARRLSLMRALASLGSRAASKATSIMLNVLISGALNRREVATTIRYFGRQGEQMLTYLMSQNHNPRIRACAAYAFGAAVSSEPFLRVIVNADFATVFTSMPRLTAVHFDHDLSSLSVPVQQVRSKKPYLLFDARELITCIRRQLNEQVYDDISSQDYSVDSQLTEFLLRILEESKAENREEQHEHTLAHNLSASNGLEETSLDMLKNSLLRNRHNFGGSMEYHPTTSMHSASPTRRSRGAAAGDLSSASFTQQHTFIIEFPERTTIRALGEAMFDSEESVRAAAAHSIGAIGMPHVHSVIGTLCAGIKDSSSKVRAQAVAAIGRLAAGFKRIIGERTNSSNQLQYDEILNVLIPMTKRIIPLLRDSFYNVRFQTVLSIREYGAEVYELEDALIKSVVKELTKVLRDGSVNRTEVAQTLVAVGDDGIHQLMNILQHETHHNSKIRMSAAVGLSSTPVESSATIDAVVETLFQAANDRVPLVRRAVLHTLGVLSRRAKESLTYLRAQSLLPFMYSFLKDHEKCVREMAAEVLAKAGPRGELLLVEGVLKDSNATIRCSAGYGLMHVGPKCVRTLLLALNDKDPHVTRAVASALEQIGAPAIVNSLKNRDSAVQQSVLSSVRDVLLIIQLIPNSSALHRMLHRIKEQLEEFLELSDEALGGDNDAEEDGGFYASERY